MQLNVLELLISQKFLPVLPAVDLTHPSASIDPQSLVDSLSECISASKSVTSALLAMPSGYENSLTNHEWIVLSWSLSFSARIDILAGGQSIPHPAQNLRRRLEFRHTLRQVLLRLQSLVSPHEDSTGDRDVFYHFLKRARGIEAWYLRQTGISSLSTPASVDVGRDQVGSTGNTAGVDFPALAVNHSGPGLMASGDLSFAGFFAEDMQNVDYGLFLGGQSFVSF